MRIIAGRLGGRVFSTPHSARTHPMADRVRGALFNVLGDLSGLTVFDPFTGSGALAYEAVSRGAATVLCIDTDKAAQKTVKENISALGIRSPDQTGSGKLFIVERYQSVGPVRSGTCRSTV